jgi:hypothetical protein
MCTLPPAASLVCVVQTIGEGIEDGRVRGSGSVSRVESEIQPLFA